MNSFVYKWIFKPNLNWSEERRKKQELAYEKRLLNKINL